VPDYRDLLVRQKKRSSTPAADGVESGIGGGSGGMGGAAVPLAALTIAVALFSGSSFGHDLLGGVINRVDGDSASLGAAPNKVRSSLPEGFKTPLERYREQGFIR
jgi:hypothetical protein